MKEKDVLQEDRTKRLDRLEAQIAESIEKRIDTEEYYKPIIKERQAVRAVKYASGKQKRLTDLLMSLSAVMLIVCFVMGAGLIQNGGRISSLERQLTQLNTAYRDLLLNITDGKSSSVFAAESVENGENTEEDANTAVGLQESTPLATVTPSVIPTTIPTPSVMPTDIPEPTANVGETDSIPTADDSQTAEAEHNVEVNVEFRLQETPLPQQNLRYNPADIPNTYMVQQGDNLSYISQKFYGDRSMVQKIMDLNGLTDPDRVYFGTVLLLPK